MDRVSDWDQVLGPLACICFPFALACGAAANQWQSMLSPKCPTSILTCCCCCCSWCTQTPHFAASSSGQNDDEDRVIEKQVEARLKLQADQARERNKSSASAGDSRRSPTVGRGGTIGSGTREGVGNRNDGRNLGDEGYVVNDQPERKQEMIVTPVAKKDEVDSTK